MEVLTTKAAPGVLPNVAVMEMLGKKVKKRKEKEAKDKRRSKKKEHQNKFRHRDWIEEQVYEYLQTTPCVTSVEASQLKELQAQLMSSKKQAPSGKATGFSLTQAESVQILNFMPTEPVEIHLMVEELHARLSEQRQEELLEAIGTYRKDIPQPAPAEDEEAMDVPLEGEVFDQSVFDEEMGDLGDEAEEFVKQEL